MKTIITYLLILLSFSNLAFSNYGETLANAINEFKIDCEEGALVYYILEDLDKDQYCGQYQTCMPKEELDRYFSSGNKSLGGVNFVIGFIISYILGKELDRHLDYEQVREKVMQSIDEYAAHQQYHARRIMEQNLSSAGCVYSRH